MMMNGYIKQIATKRLCLKQDFPRISWENLGKNRLSPEIWGIPEILGAVGTLIQRTAFSSFKFSITFTHSKEKPLCFQNTLQESKQ